MKLNFSCSVIGKIRDHFSNDVVEGGKFLLRDSSGQCAFHRFFFVGNGGTVVSSTIGEMDCFTACVVARFGAGDEAFAFHIIKQAAGGGGADVEFGFNILLINLLAVMFKKVGEHSSFGGGIDVFRGRCHGAAGHGVGQHLDGSDGGIGHKFSCVDCKPVYFSLIVRNLSDYSRVMIGLIMVICGLVMRKSAAVKSKLSFGEK